MKDKTAADQLILARTSLLLDHYFFGRLVMGLRMVEDLTIPTLAVDGKHIFYNPEFTKSLSAPLRKSAMAHEVMHCVLDHISRRGGRDPRDWNKAGDYVINLSLEKNKFEIGKGWLLSHAFDGMSTEQVYDIIHQDDDDKAEPMCDVRQATTSTADKAMQQIEWQIAVQSAAAAAQKIGKLPADMERFCDIDVAPKVSWRETLHQFFDQQTRNDYSWLRPNKRFLHYGFYMPSLAGEGMGHVVTCVDTSGSIGQEMLNIFAAEIQAVQQATRPEKITVIYCDARVNRVDEFGPDDQVELHMVGGGGTSFVPPFEYVAEKGIVPKALIYLTDMLGDFPEEPPYPVLWAATTNVVGPFGTTLQIET